MKAIATNADYVDSNWSATVEATTLMNELEMPDFTDVIKTYQSVSLAWNAVDHASGYSLAYKLAADAEFVEIPVYETSYTLSGLSSASVYEFRVKAVGEGTYTDSDWSPVVSVETYPVPERDSIVVTTNLDVVDPYDGLISLREAISYAGTDSLGSVVTFHWSLMGSTIKLNGSPLVVDRPLEINAGSLGSQSVTIDANGASSVIVVSGGTEESPVALVNLTLTGGKPPWYGGNLRNEGRTIVLNSRFYNGFAYYGGAIANEGNLTLADCEFSNNRASHGAVVYNNADATLTMFAVNAYNNKATNYGAVVYNAGSLRVSAADFHNNVSNNRGGVVYNVGGTAAIESSSMNDNHAKNYGGAIYNDATLNLAYCSFTSNSSLYGGGIMNRNSLTVVACNFAGNTATQKGGAIYHSSSLDVNITGGSISENGALQGGGLYVLLGTVRLTGTEFKSNSSTHNGGAIYNKDQVVLTDCVVTENAAKFYGGGIYNEKIVRLVGSTSVADNATETDKSPNIHTKSGGQVVYDSELAESVFDETADWLVEL